MMNKRTVTFLVVLVVCIGGVYAYMAQLKSRTSEAHSERAVPQEQQLQMPAAAESTPEDAKSESDVLEASAKERSQQRLYFRYNGVDEHYGKVAFTTDPSAQKLSFVDNLNCEVVYVAGGRGVCLSAKRGVFTTYEASLFDASTFEVTHRLPLKGIPSRARVSSDGTLAAWTVFVTGHGYTTLDFSTETLLVDANEGRVVADLETFTVMKDGAVFKREDFNFWGVTFTPDSKHFFATLSTERKHYLVKGDIAARTAQVIHENVECPSVSPDGRRVAYKKRFIVDNRIVWQLHVLDLATGRETALSEKRSIDDQLEWMGNDRVLYSVPSDDASGASTDVWAAPADASSAPMLLLRNAYSPAFVRSQSDT